MPYITDELSIEANNLDPEQTAPIGAVCSGSTLFAIEIKHFSRQEKQMTFVAIGTLRVKTLIYKNESRTSSVNFFLLIIT